MGPGGAGPGGLGGPGGLAGPAGPKMNMMNPLALNQKSDSEMKAEYKQSMPQIDAVIRKLETME